MSESAASSKPAQPASEAGPRDLAAAVALLATTVGRVEHGAAGSDEVLDALTVLRRVQGELVAFEPVLIAAARAGGVSWQSLAPALGVASRQAAERRYLRSTAAPTDQPGATLDTRVQAERDRRAGERAVTRWANDNTADLRQLAGQITALADLDDIADEALARLHEALGSPDAAALPALLAAVQRHLRRHPGLTSQIEAVTAHTDHIREHLSRQHHRIGPGDGGTGGTDGISPASRGIRPQVEPEQQTGHREHARTAAVMRSTAEQLRLAARILQSSAAAARSTPTRTRLKALGAAVSAQADDIQQRADHLTRDRPGSLTPGASVAPDPSGSR